MTSNEHQLERALDALPREKMPQRDLWQGIELGIEQQQHAGTEKTHKAPPRFAIAASFAVVAMAGWLVIQQLNVEPTQESIAPSAEQLASVLSSQHQIQRDQLLVSLEGQPALTENWQEQLQELDDAAAAIKAALAQDPNNAALLKMLQNVYQQQISLIERVHSPKWRQI